MSKTRYLKFHNTYVDMFVLASDLALWQGVLVFGSVINEINIEIMLLFALHCIEHFM